MRTLLIDGDPLVYIGACRAETKVDWGDGEATRYGDADKAIHETTRMVDKLKEELEADDVIVCLSDPSHRYFRHDIYPPYKQHRTHGTPPTDRLAVERALREGNNFKIKSVATLEADDVLGILATHPTMVPGEKIVVGIDKDLLQIPGRHYNPNTGVDQSFNKFDADLWFYFQTLMGDPTDGFPGCPRVGVKRASIILHSAQNLDDEYSDSSSAALYWKAILHAYSLRNLDEAYALTQAQVARICRYTDYDFTNKKVIPWTPPTM